MFSKSDKQAHLAVSANQSKNYNGIDVVKFLCAILIFTIHVTPFQGETSVLQDYINLGTQYCLCRLAVPFYFICSGFFLFKKMPLYNLDIIAIQNYCFKILRLIGIWHVLLIIGGTWHLWYLGATVVAVILLSLCLYFRIKFRYICVLAVLLYAIGLLGDSYYGLIAPLENITVFKYFFHIYDLTFATTRNGVFMGFPLILIGAAFSHYQIRLNPLTALVGFVVSTLCLAVEAFLLIHNNIPVDYNMYIFLVPAAFFMFAFASAVRLKDREIYRHLRNIGMLLYFSHLLVYKFVSLILGFLEQNMGIDLISYQFVLTFVAALLFAVFAQWLSCKDKFKWIGWLLS